MGDAGDVHFDAVAVERNALGHQVFALPLPHRELRTPLATTQALLEVARRDPSRDDGELLEGLHTVNARAIDLTEALLLLSRAEQKSFPRERVDLSLVAEEAIETLLPMAEERGVTIEPSGEEALIIGSRPLLLQLGGQGLDVHAPGLEESEHRVGIPTIGRQGLAYGAVVLERLQRRLRIHL